ncbi:MAG TPA: phosphoribosylformylglycinamidine synthase subunit PurQ [Myxococcota bacterium]|nr:phosphoribosylformylglycinamidine synthase subunit PurQ [Myxococcota bacterium]HRY93538.1 phosphoribosylformylglycinamidine synthase subunit PurQ [Myxococcota bacterium]HSA21240.1 phosphoribosylformylglycinamidine synthase subunit PurQ [Myxococcota bacterium]
MAKVRALVVSGNGTNCERETAEACRLGGADEVVVSPIWDLSAGETRLRDFRLLCLPGGFMDGDDLGSARAAANRWRHARVAGGERRLWDDLRAFVEAGGLVIGICNGFQLLVKLGMLPRLEAAEPVQRVTLTFNASGRFEDRWVTLVAEPRSPCLFTRGIERLELPVRHGEGRLVGAPEELEALTREHLCPLRYADPATGQPTEQYPLNPNGSPGGVAALCDPSGRLFGLMPHPEAFLHRTLHPRWTREPGLPEEGAGVAIFRNAVQALR